MRLIEALQALKQSPPPGSSILPAGLACGFTPLHFQTYLTAYLRALIPKDDVRVETGLYGDLIGNVARLEDRRFAFGVVLVEWPDLDARLGIRGLGGWKPQQLPDILRSAEQQAARLAAALGKTGEKRLVAVSLPTLPLPPIAYTPGWQSSSFEHELLLIVASLAAQLSKCPGVRLVNSQRLLQTSPFASRHDVKSEITTGFPYSLSHADALASLIARLVENPVPKKGLITDLDDTLWQGILGEVGVEGIAWDLDRHAHEHGLYQQFVTSLAEAGILVAVASKNEPSLVEEAFERAKPIISRSKIFPMEVNWGPKSESVARILSAWNVGPESVVFVDDSPLDLAEVKRAHPQIECMRFEGGDVVAVYSLIGELRDLFGKQTVSAEDEIRLESLRAREAATLAPPASSGSLEQFRQEARGVLTLGFSKSPLDPRALDLINKTNQFNLNGKRHTDASWRQYLADPKAFLLIGSFEDKFGPLGKIAVVAGRQDGHGICIDYWVMSCRAFSRRIEHACLFNLFQKFEAEKAHFDFIATPRNQPLQLFFSDLMGVPPVSGFSLSREQFLERCPPTYIRTEEHTE